MNDKLEQIERLREKAKVSYDEAKHAYEAAGGDLLEALILLEKQGKVKPPEGNGFYSSEQPKVEQHQDQKRSKGEDFEIGLKRFWQFLVGLFHRCNNTTVEMIQNNETKVKVPLTLMIVFTLFCPWIVIILGVLGLFFNFKYRVYENEPNGE